MSWAEIRVRCCDVCGEHPTQESPEGEHVQQRFYVESMELVPCDDCGVICCHSCKSDHHCCEAEVEARRIAKRNGRLF